MGELAPMLLPFWILGASLVGAVALSMIYRDGPSRLG